MSESSRSKWIMVVLVIGLLIGGLAVFLISPSPDISGYQEQIEQLETQVTTLQDRSQDLEEELVDVVSADDYTTLENQFNELNSQLTVIQGELEGHSDLEQQVAQLKSELENAVSANEYTTLENQFNELKSQLTSLQGEIDEKEDTIDDLQNTISELEALVPPLPPKEGEPGSSRFFPAEIGDAVTCVFEYHGKIYTARITVKEFIRGDLAWSMIHEANMFNDPAQKGAEYVLAKIRFEYVSGATAETKLDIFSFDFDAVSEDGYVYDWASVVEPEPRLEASLYPGASHEGWAAYGVYKIDSKPVLSFAGTWFKLYE